MTGRAVVPLGRRRAPDSAPGRVLAPQTTQTARVSATDPQTALSGQAGPGRERREAEGGLWRDGWSLLRSGGRTERRTLAVAGGIGAGATGIGLIVVPDAATVLADLVAVGVVAAVIVARRTRWGRRLAARWGHLLVERPHTAPGLWEAVPDDWQDDQRDVVVQPGRVRTAGSAAGDGLVVPVAVTVSVVPRTARPRPVGGRARALPARSGVPPFPVDLGVDVDPAPVSARAGSVVPR